CCSALAELPSALRSSAQRGELQQANLNKKGQPFCGWPKVLLGLLHLEKLEGEVSVESHGTVGPGVSPGFAECTWCNSSSIHTVYVAIVDVESRYAQELVVESIEDVGTKLQSETLVQSNVLAHCEIQLVSRHGAELIATGCTGERVA